MAIGQLTNVCHCFARTVGWVERSEPHQTDEQATVSLLFFLFLLILIPSRRRRSEIKIKSKQWWGSLRSTHPTSHQPLKYRYDARIASMMSTDIATSTQFQLARDSCRCSAVIVP